MTMSFKYAVQKVSDNHYVLPKVGSMKVDAHAFLSEDLFHASEEKVWQQIAHGASYERVTGAYLMPDTHTGYGVPVGSVIVTDGTIIQGGSGYDISCGVLYMKADLTAAAIKGKHKRERWVKEVERRIATGAGHHRPDLMPRFTQEKADDILRFGAKAIGVEADVCERQFIPVPEGIDLTRIERAHASVVRQLGSVGGGNHFVEMQCDRDTAEVYVMVHCGSRGYGWQTANHFFYEGARLRGLPSNRRED
jgi:tRNA-splicing ligase RtcB